MLNADGLYAFRHYIYLVICKDPLVEDVAYMKVGRSVDPIKRFQQVRSGSPLPILKASYVQTPGIKSARKVEQRLLQDLAVDGTRGEWVRLRWNDPKHREQVMQVIFCTLDSTLRQWELVEVDVDAALRLCVAAESAIRKKREQRAKSRKAQRITSYRLIGRSA